MTLHLPYSESPQDEFLHPGGEWFYVFRALSLDSWLTWRHALPASPASRSMLTIAEAVWIETLGDALHRVHQTLRGYSRLSDTPFVVQRWYDPHDPGTPWAEGRRCRFSLKDTSPEDFAKAAGEVIRPRWLTTKATPDGWIEATALALPVRNRRRAQRSRKSLKS